MREMTLDGRLFSVGKFVRQGAQFADIGTDHAYLPIYLLKHGIIKSAVAADINEGPLNSAREHASTMGITDNIRLVRDYENSNCKESALSLARSVVSFQEQAVERTKGFL
jgi:tRNA A22 N-methylase